MRAAVLTVKLHNDVSLVLLRDRCRQVGELFGLESLQRTRFITAVSEIGRNALQYAGGATATFYVGVAAARAQSQAVAVEVVDKGPGLAPSVWADGSLGKAQLTGGIAGAQRLADGFWIVSSASAGTSVTLEMLLPRQAPPLGPADIARGIDELIRRRPRSALEESENQNREMLFTLDELRRRQADLELADLRKNEFLAMLAHELRNPLGAITMTVAVLQRQNKPTHEDFARHRDVIARQAAQLTRLIDDLMDVSRISLGKVELQLKPVDVRALVEQAVEMTQSFVDAKRHRLSVQLPAQELWVQADTVRMKQVISNLLHNAARYTAPAGELAVVASRDGDMVEIAIVDNGIGIPAAMLPKVFDLFAQGDSGLARADAGLGVGLTIVQRLVSDHGGSVHASSRGPGCGSRFTLRLPLIDKPGAAVAPSTVQVQPSGTGKVLVVDDNVDATLALKDCLELSGFVCISAHDGLAALAAAQGAAITAAVIDLGLPRIDGFGVARALRAACGPALTLVAMSGYSSPDIDDRVAAAGFDAFLIKPFDLDVLLRLLSVTLQPQHQH